MAGFLPELALLPPTSSVTPYRMRTCARDPSTSPLSAASNLSRTPTTISRLPNTGRHLKKAPPSYETPKASPSDARKSPPAARKPSYTITMEPSPRSSTTASPPSVPQRTSSLRQKTSFRFFGRHKVRPDPTPPKPKRNTLVKKRASEPTFEMVSPPKVRAEGAKKAAAAAARLGFQLADFVDEIDAETVGVAVSEGEAAAAAAAAAATAVAESANPNAYDNDNLAPNAMDEKQFKRWSLAPILPELDFGSSSSDITSLDDTETHEPPAEASIDAISVALLAAQSDSVATPYTSDNPKELTYRCDIHAKDSTSHQITEQACQELVTRAGGRIIGSYVYSGGFLFSVPPNIAEPIRTCELPALRAKIEVEKWAEFPEAKFNGLRMHPPNLVKNSCSRPAAVGGMTEQLQWKSRVRNKEAQMKKWMESEGVAAVLEKSEKDSGETGNKANPETAGMTRRGATEVPKAAIGGDAIGGDEGDARTPDDAVSIASKSTVKCLPVIGTALKTIKSQDMLKRVASRRASVGQLTSPKSTHSIASQRFAVVANPSDSDNESSSEEWESVRSELDN